MNIRNSFYTGLSSFLAVTLLLAPAIVTSADLEDNASDSAYDLGWQAGDNGNIGSTSYPAWFSFLTGASTATIGSAPGIDIGGESFILTRSSSSDNAFMARVWTLPTPDPIATFSYDLSVVSGEGGFMGIAEAGTTESAVFSVGSNWTIGDSSTTSTSIPVTDPIRVTYFIDSDATYDIQVTNLNTSTVFSATGRTTVNGVNLATADVFELGAALVTGVGAVGLNNIRMDNSLITFRDNAGEGVYSDGWSATLQDIGNAGGETSPGPWQFNLPAGSTSSVASAGLTDVNGASFVLTRGTSASDPTVVRDEVFSNGSNPTTIIQFAAEMLTGTGGQISFVDTDGPSTGVTVTGVFGVWVVADGTGNYISSFPDTDPVLVSFTGDDLSTTYDLTIRNLATSTTETSTGRTFTDGGNITNYGEWTFGLLFDNSSMAFNSLAIDDEGSIPVPVEVSTFKLE